MTDNHQDSQEMSEEELLEAALAELSQELPGSLAGELSGDLAGDLAEEQLPPAIQGSTLEALDTSRHPTPATVCEQCPNSIWLASEAEVKCYCRIMYQVVWTSLLPNSLTHCDGQFITQE